ncbi:MAG: biotin transporter BioY [Spirochaetaceae bacterium]|nr:biotin transporter BioY [Spirochaetaceae bacterium]MCF7948939.1 biotin transporter BioY [Spirochaetia bacterium]MCF7950903.1 biotin transporter BioY [Spirochaetaceae bacterium]
MNNLRATVAAAGFTALIAIGAYISIPVGPVPIVLQNFFVLLSALLLGSKIALSSVFVYLFLGALGLPVFAGGTGGIGHFFGPTGGYLIAYLPAVVITGFIARRPKRRTFSTLNSVFLQFTALLAGTLCIYLIGVPWLKYATQMSWKAAIGAGAAPFILGDLLKIVVAFIIGRSFSSRVDEFLQLAFQKSSISEST